MNATSLVEKSDNAASRRWDSKEIGVFGYFGGRNLGDDLMLESLLPTLGDDVVLFARAASEVEAGCSEEVEVLTASAPAILRRLPSLRRLVRCGGTVFHDEVGQPQMRVAMNYALQVSLLAAARLVGARPALLGIGVGKVERRTTRLALLAALHISNPVVFRDGPSLERARALGFRRGVLGVDLAFVGHSTPLASRAADEGHTIAVSPVDLERYGISWHDADPVGGWVRLINACLGEVGGVSRVEVLAFKDNERESDVPICEQIVERLLDEGVEAVLVGRTDARASVERADSVIAARFHAGILAAISGKPLVLVPYNLKIASLGSDLGIVDAVVDPERPFGSITPKSADVSSLRDRVNTTQETIARLVEPR